MLSFFVLDGIFLWLVVIGFAVATVATIEYESPKWCTVVIAVTLFVLEFYSPWHPVRTAIHHPVDAVVIVAIYFAIGTAWIVGKWWFHINWVGDKFDEIKDDCAKRAAQHGADYRNADGSLNAQGIAKMYEIAAGRLNEWRLPLQVSQHKGELYMWWLCWPLSVAWTCLNDPVKRLWRFVYRELGTLLQRMSDRRFKM